MPYPLDPLSPAEIQSVTETVRAQFPPGAPITFCVCTLHEPPKDLLFPYLQSLSLSHAGQSTLSPAPPRLARVHVVTKLPRSSLTPSAPPVLETYAPGMDPSRPDKDNLFEFIVEVGGGVKERVGHRGRFSFMDVAFLEKVQERCLADEGVRGEIGKMGLPEGVEVVVEGWEYSADGENDLHERTTMCWFYLKRIPHPDTNHYAFPLSLCAEMNSALQVTKLYHLPITSISPHTTTETPPFNPLLTHDPSTTEYHPSLRPPPRPTTKPLLIHQPHGPSFTLSGHLLTWEHWTLRIGFNYREGLTLHDIRYQGRPLFYRMALSEMFVPYGDPRRPYPRKAAFDLGCDGAGINANNLQLGCDCLGHIAYISGTHVNGDGSPEILPNVVCIHEQDDGILWKHTSFRSGNAVVARSRLLVIQTIITVSNYEYIFAWYLSQDGSIQYEVRATGILSTAPIGVDEETPNFATRVGKGVIAPFHQHLFCLRIDPMLDGRNNSFVVQESVPLPIDDPTVHNPYAVGYTTCQEIITTEQSLDLNHVTGRIFKIINENSVNPVTGTPVAFKLQPFYSQPLLAHPSSFHAQRSEFGKHAVWVTKYHDHELFPAGNFTMQSAGGEGIASKILARAKEGRGAIRDEDIVVWHTFGSTHNPRLEDWPVMPSEKMAVMLKPVNFFSGNPGIDVRPSRQEENCSVLVMAGSEPYCCGQTGKQSK